MASLARTSQNNAPDFGGGFVAMWLGFTIYYRKKTKAINDSLK